MKVYAHLLVWNDRKYLEDLFASFQAQTFKDFTVRALDNGSTDDTVTFLQSQYPDVLIARNKKNEGFAPGHNQLMQFTLEHLDPGDVDPYILIVNSDMILHPELIERLVRVLDEHPEISGVQPKLYRAFSDGLPDDVLEETVKSDILDTTGLRLNKNFRMTDRGAGELDRGQYDSDVDIIAPTGTMAMYRLSALRSTFINGTWFDGSFFAYREDCDFALRFKKAGHRSLFVPEAIAWHFRGMFGAEKLGFIARLKNRQKQRPFFAALSTRNQTLVLIKHLSFGLLLRYGWRILPLEFLRIVYGLFFEPLTRRRLLTMFPLILEAIRERRLIREMTKITEEELRAYVGK